MKLNKKRQFVSQHLLYDAVTKSDFLKRTDFNFLHIVTFFAISETETIPSAFESVKEIGMCSSLKFKLFKKQAYKPLMGAPKKFDLV